MSFAREGLVFIAVAALVAAGTYALALNRRSWPLWLLAFAVTIVALWVAYFFRDPQRAGAGAEQVVVAPADGRVVPTGRFLDAAVERSRVAVLIARRIVTPTKEGEQVQQATRMGSIRFGSRVVVFVPLSAQIKVGVGGLTLAGSTGIAHLGAR